MKKLTAMLLLMICLLGMPLLAYAADGVELEDTPYVEEDAGGGGLDDSTATTSEPNAENSDKPTEAPASGTVSPGVEGGGQIDSPVTSESSDKNSDRPTEVPASDGKSYEVGGGEQIDSPVTNKPSAENSDKPIEAPTTGTDSQMIGNKHVPAFWIGMLVFAGLGLTVVYVVRKRKSK